MLNQCSHKIADRIIESALKSSENLAMDIVAQGLYAVLTE